MAKIPPRAHPRPLVPLRTERGGKGSLERGGESRSRRERKSQDFSKRDVGIPGAELLRSSARLRANLSRVVDRWWSHGKGHVLISATVDPARFFGLHPADVLVEVLTSRYLVRLINELGLKRWVRIVAVGDAELRRPGRRDPGENVLHRVPHWHLIVRCRVDALGRPRISQKRWLRVQEKWAQRFGNVKHPERGLHLSRGRRDLAWGAARYLIDENIKPTAAAGWYCEVGEWLQQQHGRRLEVLATSKGIRPLLASRRRRVRT